MYDRVTRDVTNRADVSQRDQLISRAADRAAAEIWASAPHKYGREHAPLGAKGGPWGASVPNAAAAIRTSLCSDGIALLKSAELSHEAALARAGGGPGTTALQFDSMVGDEAGRDIREQQNAEAFLNAVLRELGRPIRVFMTHPYWKPIGVDTSRPLDRSGGVGDQPLHMDFVNAEFPPDIIVLHCVRADPAGGGFSRYADFHAAVGQLSRQDREALSEPVFRDGRVTDLDELGMDVNPFRVLVDGDGHIPRYRYTGNLLGTEVPVRHRRALRNLDAALTELEHKVRLEAGTTLFIDNRRTVHSRGRLGDNQDLIPTDRRRLLVQGFIRLEDKT